MAVNAVIYRKKPAVRSRQFYSPIVSTPTVTINTMEKKNKQLLSQHYYEESFGLGDPP